MGTKKRGHYCKICGRYRANEKFSGKGHRQHICKECKRNPKIKEEITVTAKRSNVHMKAVKIKIAMFMDTDDYLIFEYAGKVFAMNANLEYSPNIIQYEKKHEYPFLLSKAFSEKELDDLLYILAVKDEGVHYYDFDEVTEGIVDVPPKLQKYIPLFPTIKIIDQRLRKYLYEE